MRRLLCISIVPQYGPGSMGGQLTSLSNVLSSEPVRLQNVQIYCEGLTKGGNEAYESLFQVVAKTGSRFHKLLCLLRGPDDETNTCFVQTENPELIKRYHELSEKILEAGNITKEKIKGNPRAGEDALAEQKKSNLELHNKVIPQRIQFMAEQINNTLASDKIGIFLIHEQAKDKVLDKLAPDIFVREPETPLSSVEELVIDGLPIKPLTKL